MARPSPDQGQRRVRPPRILFLPPYKEIMMKTKFVKLFVALVMVIATLVLLYQVNVPFHNAVITLMGGGAGGTGMNVDFNPLSTPTPIP